MELGLEKAKHPFLLLSATYYPTDDSSRFVEALKTATLCQDLGIPVVIVDSGSSQNNLYCLRDKGVRVIEATGSKGQADQLLIGVRHIDEELSRVSRHMWVCKAELEKNIVPWFRSLRETDSDIVIASRHPRLRSTMPHALEIAERHGGEFLQAQLGLPTDAMFGIVVYHPDIFARLWRRYGKLVEERGDEFPVLRQWAYLYLLPLWARDEELLVGEVAIDYVYPAVIVQEEDTEQKDFYIGKRRTQLESQLKALAALCENRLPREEGDFAMDAKATDPIVAINAALTAYDTEIAVWK